MRRLPSAPLFLAAALCTLAMPLRGDRSPAPPTQKVQVTPTAGQTPPRAPNSYGFTATFTVKNIGTVTSSYEIWCESSSNVVCAGMNPSDSVRNLAPNATANVTVTYNTGAVGMGFVKLGAANDYTMAFGRYDVPVGNDVVTVTPDGGTATGDPYLPYTQVFTLTTQAYAENVNLSPVCTGSGVASSCSVTPTSMSLGAFASANATVNYTTRGNGTSGRVTLKALDPNTQAVRDTGWITVTVGTTGGNQQAPIVNVVDVNGGTVVEPSLCLTVALGSGAAAACGDLRLVHALPTLRTYNQRRTPVLLYSSAVAEPAGQVAALVTVPNGAASPDSIVGRLSVGGVVRDAGTWTGNEWEPGRARRILLRFAAPTWSSGLYDYSLEVTSYYGYTPQPTTATGQFIIINRRQTAFGSGWWLAGLEWLNTSNMLWLGGDGSARVYQATGISNTWAAPAVDFPDTLVYVNGEYIRRGPGKLEVHFNASGQHVATINRLGHVTSFSYDGSGRLSTITVPAPAGTLRRYYFQYGTGSVTVTDSSSPGDPLKHQVLLYLSSSGRMDSIADAAGTVRFGYADTSSRRVTTRTDRRGAVRTFTYNSGGRIATDSLNPGAGEAAIVLRLRPIESQGLHGTGTPSSVDPTQAYSLVDGPRTDVGDSTMFFLDRYGAPKTIQDAMGGVTRLVRNNGTYPALVTSVTYPDSGVVNATYNARGHVATVSDTRAIVRGNPSAATVTTSYTWDPVFDAVTAVYRPEYGRDSVLYDPATGNRLWEQNPAGYRVQYTYYSLGYPRAPGILASVRAPGASAADTVIYDATLGNVDSVRTPLGFWTRSYADNRGRDTLTVSPMDSVQTRFILQHVGYDAMDRVVGTTTDAPASPYFNDWTLQSDSMWAQSFPTTYWYDAEGNRTQVWARDPAPPDSLRESTHEWSFYDLAGRDTSHTLAGRTTRTAYDPAGNPTQVTTQRSSFTMTYDAMNRLATRIVPAYTYSSEGCTYTYPDCAFAFPLYPNDGGSGLQIAADTARFTYDIAGRLRTANNGDAHVSRTYAKNGWVLTDTLFIRNYGSNNFGVYAYGLQMRYDSLGRRVVLKIPSSLASYGADSMRYIYNSQTGALQEVRGLTGNRFVYSDDSLGRQVGLSIYAASDPNNVKVQETRTYDADSRLRARVTTAPGTGTVVQRDTMWYDARGKILRARYFSAAVGSGTWNMAYAGLGGVIYTAKLKTSPSPETWIEEWRRDVFGNTLRLRKDGQTFDPIPKNMTYDQYGRISTQATPDTMGGWQSWVHVPDSLYLNYDAASNLHYREQHQYAWGAPFDITSWITERQYYAADDRLRVVQRVQFGEFAQSIYYPGWPAAYLQAPRYGVWEEYRYDALGRRVMVRARRDQLANGVYDHSTLDRLVWDGDQLLFELRAPGYPDNVLDGNAYGQPNGYGKVGYVHGRSLDQPLALTDGRVPLLTWRGAAESSVWDSTGQPADCSRLSPCDTTQMIDWPENRWDVEQAPWVNPGGSTPYRYVGSLIQGSQDGTGMMYRRNRYYDPQTGRFTQVDPIGLAGGLNAYGFGAGDPVNFADPFGTNGIKEALKRLWNSAFAKLRHSFSPQSIGKDAAGQIVVNGVERVVQRPSGDPQSDTRTLDFALQLFPVVGGGFEYSWGGSEAEAQWGRCMGRAAEVNNAGGRVGCSYQVPQPAPDTRQSNPAPTAQRAPADASAVNNQPKPPTCDSDPKPVRCAQ